MVENKRIAVASTTINTILFLDTASARNDLKSEQSFLVARTVTLKAPNATAFGGRVYNGVMYCFLSQPHLLYTSILASPERTR